MDKQQYIMVADGNEAAAYVPAPHVLRPLHLLPTAFPPGLPTARIHRAVCRKPWILRESPIWQRLKAECRLCTSLTASELPHSYDDTLCVLGAVIVKQMIVLSCDFVAYLCGGRYGLSSKDTTPAQIKAVFDHLVKDCPAKEFTPVNAPADNIQHGSLAGAVASHHRDKFFRRNPQIKVVKKTHFVQQGEALRPQAWH